jgi:hypothetical protein
MPLEIVVEPLEQGVECEAARLAEGDQNPSASSAPGKSFADL